MSQPILGPPTIPYFGNLFSLDRNDVFQSIKIFFDKYGEIFKLNILGSETYFVGSVKLLEELCDETRFHKKIGRPLEECRYIVNDGLFTAFHGEPQWEIAHRILVPSFGPLTIKEMFDSMHDISTQLVAKWARMGESHVINAPDDYTRLTLDTLALCAMDVRYNSFYKENMHEFIECVLEFLKIADKRYKSTSIQKALDRHTTKRMQYCRDLVRSIAQEAIDHRKSHPSDKKDLLNAMLLGKDPKTGEMMDSDSVINNMVTFIVAGHETTSGLISFATYFLLKNPHTLQKAQAEVDRVVGKGPIRYEHMAKLPYIEAVLRESLRLNPTASQFGLTPVGNESVALDGGRYVIPAGAQIAIWLTRIGQDPEVWGDDAEVFDPERMLGERFARLPPAAFKVFGNGARACIGRSFAWQEATLALAMVLQNFNLQLNDPSYTLKIKFALTQKPDQLFIKARLRDGIDALNLEKRLHADVVGEVSNTKGIKPTINKISQQHELRDILLLYGSNAGTCEGLAQSLAGTAAAHGFLPKVKTLDDAVDKFPCDRPVVVITSSYEGNPTDNAALFVEWLKKVDQSVFKGAQVAVFGVGHRDWRQTYQKIPTLVDQLLTKKGAASIVPRGESNAQENKIFDDFDSWTEKLWESLGSRQKAEEVHGLNMELSTNSRSTHLRQYVQNAVVIKNELLTPAGAPEKRHIEFQLPSDATYEAGDYLAILPVNHVETISRVLRRFKLPWDATMKLSKGSHSTIPTEVELPVSNVLAAYVELKTPVTKKALSIINEYAQGANSDVNGDIESNGAISQESSVNAETSLLDMVEKDPTNPIPFSVFLSLLPPLRIRQYSISSSPFKDANTASITFAVYSNKATAHLGVATSYLSQLKPGSIVQLAIKKSHAAFHLPIDDEKTPVLMGCAGSGIAPFRGFVQERAAKIAAGRKLAPAILFIGCRGPSVGDNVHQDELLKWQAEGVVQVFYAYSKEKEKSEGHGYVQERIWEQRELIKQLFVQGARVYVCGSGKVGKSIDDVAIKIASEMQSGSESERQLVRERVQLKLGRKIDGQVQEADFQEWWAKLRGERYAVDVFD